MNFGSNRRQLTMLTLRYLILSVISVTTIAPLIYMVLISFKKNVFIVSNPMDAIIGSHTLGNYIKVWNTSHMSVYFMNSLIVALVTTGFTVFLGSMMAYAFARFDFPGRRLLMGILLAELMIPAIMILIPQFLLARDLHLLDSLAGLILFYVGANLAFNTFLMIGFFRGIPSELDDAMRVDGAGSWRRYWQLILPLSRPALAAAGIFSFLGSWDEYVWALTIINDPSKRTMPIGIALFNGAHVTDWGLTFAASTISLLPVLVIFLVFQRQFVNGVISGALKS
jgi:ABC-type glycerol-3-phosphate transport system permease component